MGIRMQKDPWWVRHKTIGFIVGVTLACFAFLALVIVDLFEQILARAKKVFENEI